MDHDLAPYGATPVKKVVSRSKKGGKSQVILESGETIHCLTSSLVTINNKTWYSRHHDGERVDRYTRKHVIQEAAAKKRKDRQEARTLRGLQHTVAPGRDRKDQLPDKPVGDRPSARKKDHGGAGGGDRKYPLPPRSTAGRDTEWDKARRSVGANKGG